MIKRGRVVRDTNAGEGLISCEGKQYPFNLESNWDCDLTPRQNMVVDIEFDHEGKFVAAWAVDEKELAKEQASLLINETKQKAATLYTQIESLVGRPVLAATAALIVGWFMLNTLVIDIGFTKQTLAFNFWQLLGIVNNANNVQALMMGGFTGGSKGIYGLLCIAALAGPFLYIFWKHPLAHLGNCLALALVLIVLGSAYMTIHEQMEASKQAMGFFGGDKAQSFADKAIDEAMKMVKFGLGAYVWALASLYLAYVGISKYLVSAAMSRLSDTTSSTSTRRPSGRRSANRASVPQASAASATPSVASSHNCPSCNTASEANAAFCSECGFKLS